MAWDMFPNGTSVKVDVDTRLGLQLAEKLFTRGIDPLRAIMRVAENKMVEANATDAMIEFRRIPHIVVVLPGGECIETEPVALTRAF